MSLLPLILQDHLDDFCNMSIGIPTHRFGFGFDGADYYRPFKIVPFNRARNQDSEQVAKRDEPFKVNLNVHEFAPNELSITTTGNMITVEGKHEEKSDEHGLVWRHFVRKYLVPEGHNLEQAVSNLSSNGILTVTAPKIGEEKKESIAIPITHTIGEPQSIEQKK